MHNIHLKIHYFLKKEINELYVTHALRSFAMSTISVFLPIFLLQRGYSLNEVMLYFFLHVFLGTVFFYMSMKLSCKKGIKHSIAASIPILAVFFICLHQIIPLTSVIGRINTLILIDVLITLSMAMYYAGFHIDFAKFSEKKKSTKQISIIQALALIFSILGPLFGAVMISFYSFEILFIIIIGILVASGIPLMFSGEFHEPLKFKMKNIFSKKVLKTDWVFFAEGMRDYAARIFWPLLLYFLMMNLSEIGGIYTISNALLAIFTLYMGKKMTSKNRNHLMNIGAIIHSFSLAIRTLLKTLSMIAVTQGVGAISFTMINLPFHSTFYNNSKKRGIGFAIFSREVYLHIGRLLFLIIVSLLLLFMQVTLALMIAIMIGSFFTLLMTKITDD